MHEYQETVYSNHALQSVQLTNYLHSQNIFKPLMHRDNTRRGSVYIIMYMKPYHRMNLDVYSIPICSIYIHAWTAAQHLFYTTVDKLMFAAINVRLLTNHNLSCTINVHVFCSNEQVTVTKKMFACY